MGSVNTKESDGHVIIKVTTDNHLGGMVYTIGSYCSDLLDVFVNDVYSYIIDMVHKVVSSIGACIIYILCSHLVLSLVAINNYLTSRDSLTKDVSLVKFYLYKVESGVYASVVPPDTMQLSCQYRNTRT